MARAPPPPDRISVAMADPPQFSLLLRNSNIIICLLLYCFFLLCICSSSAQQLSPDFYSSSCPNAVSIISNTFKTVSKSDNVVPPSVLRLISHDCFVEGCDASILISSTSSNKAERDAPDNQNLPQNAFNAIDQIKKAVEKECPGVVSCADILALASRDAVVFLGGPTWDVPLGRLDGRVSTASSVTGRLPGANFDVKQLVDNFGAVGLSLEDMVILSGAHTIGFTHCDQFQNRLYSFNTTTKTDPAINPAFSQQLQQKCPAGGSGQNLQAFDVETPFGFDNNYYKDLQQGKGILFSDQVLFTDPSTQGVVSAMAASQDEFFKKFAAAMIKMTLIGVKTAADGGEVRQQCTVINAGGVQVKPAPTTPPPAVVSIPPPTVQSPPPAVQIPPPVVKNPPPVVQNPPPVVESPPPVVQNPPPVIESPPVVQNPPPVVERPPPVVQNPQPVVESPPLVVQNPPPIVPIPPTKSNPPPVTNPPVVPSPPETQTPPVDTNPPVAPNPPESQNPPVDDNPPSVPSQAPPGFTIPGIPGFTPPIHVPFFGFGRRPAPPSSASATTTQKSRKDL